MRKVLTLFTVLLLVVTTRVFSETVPHLINYQARITNSAGNPLNGTFDIVARIYDDSTGGSLLAEHPFPGTNVSEGACFLGLPTQFPGLAPWSGTSMTSPQVDIERFLEIEVDGEIILPRTRLSSSPYSYFSHGLAGDIYTSPGHIYMVPGPDPVSDCTYVPLEMAVDETLTRIRLKPSNPVNDCTYVPFEMSVDATVALIAIKPPVPVNDCTYVPLQLSSNSMQSDITLQPPDLSRGGSMQLNTGDANTGPHFLLFKPDGTPLRAQAPSVEINGGTETESASIQMFNTEGHPGPPNLPAVQIVGGTATEPGKISVRNASASAAQGLYFPEAMLSEIKEEAGTSIPFARVFDARDNVAGGVNTGEVEIVSNADMGSYLHVEHSPSSGIAPCVRVVSEPFTAQINLMAQKPSGGGKANNPGISIPSSSDSAAINIVADTNSARIEMFGSRPGLPPAIVLKANNINGKIGINTNAPTEALHVVGNICATGTIGACSDERYKKNIVTIDDALEIIEQLRGVNFNWRTDEFPENNFSEKEQVGFIAQEIQKVLPEVVSKGSDGYYTVDYSKLTPVLVEAVKAQQNTIDEVKSKNEELAKELSELRKMVQALAAAQSIGINSELAVSELR